MSLIEKAVEYFKGSPQEKKTSLQVPEPAAVSPAAGADPVYPQVSTPHQVEIDLHKLAGEGFITPGKPNSLLAEELRVIKRPLLANARAATSIRHANLIMVTSALPGEGKSFTALNLAISIAMELDHTVLLVDADVVRPSLPSLLSLPAQKGLIDLLQNKSLQLSDVLLHSSVKKLNLLMAGTHDPHATELLASEAMARLLDEMAKRYPDRIIIFDSPPLLMATEAQVLATHMGQIVFILQAEESLQSAVKEALATLEACPVKFLVLNQARNFDLVTYGYGYKR